MAQSSSEAVSKQNSAIKAQLAHVTSLVEEYCKLSTANADKSALTVEEQGLQSEVFTNTVQEAHKLLHTIKGPLDTVYCHFENVAHTGAVRALLELGVFDALPQDGTGRTADALATELKADKLVITRLMRMATIWGPFEEVGVEEYAHTQYSRIYLVPQVRGLFKLLVDEYQPAELRFFEFFKINGWVNPIQSRNCPYTFVHRTGGKDMWEFIGQFPDRFQAFNYAMQAQSSAVSWSTALYPFHEILSQLGSTQETPLVIDIGGGKGHTLNQIKQLTGPVPGRFILQERQEVLDDIDEELPGIERQAHDFFTPQPVKGAFIYYFRRVFHDWPDATCIEILHNIAAGITDKTKQRVVIVDFIPPEKGADAEGAWSDLTMMTLHGIERTEKQWEKLLDEAGYRLGRTYLGRGTNWGAVEAFLK